MWYVQDMAVPGGVAQGEGGQRAHQLSRLLHCRLQRGPPLSLQRGRIS